MNPSGHSQTMLPVQGEGGGVVRQMSTLLYNPYRVKVATRGVGWGSKISKKWLHSL